jgi:threonine dehydrogenase-like Zn-dependent dehydrogenase
MRALFAGGGGSPHFRDIPEPTIDSPMEAIVEPIAVAICDLDIAYIANFLPMDSPYAVGHEFTARVLEVGDAVTSLVPGQIVTVPFQISCGTCNRCQQSRSDDCTSVPHLSTYGLEPFGGGAQWGAAAAARVRVPFADAMCVALPDAVDPVAAASISDNVVDGYGALASHVQPGDEAIVFGSASIGLYAVGAAEALAIPCTYVDDDPARLAVAETLGAHVIDASPDGRSFGEYPVAVACISSPEGLMSAVRSTEPGGRCHSNGIHFLGAELPWVDLYKRGITFTTGRPRARDEIPAVVALVARGAFRIGEVCASVISFEDAPEALAGPLPHKTVLLMDDRAS